MCMMSMVYDDFSKRLPGIDWFKPFTIPSSPTPDLAEELARVSKLLQEFMEAKLLAARLDELMKQKDCVDQEKKKLDERVALLEQRIEALERWRRG